MNYVLIGGDARMQSLYRRLKRDAAGRGKMHGASQERRRLRSAAAVREAAGAYKRTVLPLAAGDGTALCRAAAGCARLRRQGECGNA